MVEYTGKRHVMWVREISEEEYKRKVELSKGMRNLFREHGKIKDGG